MSPKTSEDECISVYDSVDAYDKDYLVHTLSAAKDNYEILTPNMFASMINISVMSYLRGRNWPPTDELIAAMVGMLIDFAEENTKNEEHAWFIEWVEKVFDATTERNKLDG